MTSSMKDPWYSVKHADKNAEQFLWSVCLLQPLYGGGRCVCLGTIGLTKYQAETWPHAEGKQKTQHPPSKWDGWPSFRGSGLATGCQGHIVSNKATVSAIYSTARCRVLWQNKFQNEYCMQSQEILAPVSMANIGVDGLQHGKCLILHCHRQ